MTRAALPFGFLNAFKPPGISSTAFGVWVRRKLGASSLGHWGTLDPGACGVLVLAVGDATRLLPYIERDDKSYAFEMRVGTATDTADADGRVVRTASVPSGWASNLDQVAASMCGELGQVPPMYSAVKVDGRPLYKAARAGREVERRARVVRIDALRAIEVDGERARMSVDCSAGTYVRTLCEQIGERLGLPAHLTFLIRTRVGPFELADSSTPERIGREGAACLSDPRHALSLPCVDVDAAAAARFRHGNDVAAMRDASSAVDVVDGLALVTHDGSIAGIGRVDGERIAPVRVIAGSGENG